MVKQIIFIVLIILITIINKSNANNEYHKRNFTLELYSDEYRYYNFCNTIYTDVRKPFGYIKIHNENEARDAVLFAKSIGKTVSVRAGGHSFTVQSILDNSVNLDMSGLKGIKVNKTEMTVVVQAGVLLGEYYTELYSHGLVSTGGTCGGVGLGLALGGGTGYMGSQHGYMVDNIIEHTVVLANGDIVKANKHNEYSDLHWALLGAGHGGFGVVIDYKVNVFDMQPVYYHNQILMPIDDYLNATLILNEFVESLSYQEQQITHFNILAGVFNQNEENNYHKLNFFFMKGSMSQGKQYFNRLYEMIKSIIPNAIPTPGNKSQKTFVDLLTLMPSDEPIPSRSLGKGRFVEINVDTMTLANDLLQHFKKSLTQIEEGPDSMCSQELHYHGGNQINGDIKELEKRNAFVHRGEKNKWVISLVCRYFNSDNDDQYNELNEILANNISGFSKRIYNNFPDDVYYWRTGYYGNYYPKLQMIKLKYDPTNYFKYPQSIELPYQKITVDNIYIEI